MTRFLGRRCLLVGMVSFQMRCFSVGLPWVCFACQGGAGRRKAGKECTVTCKAQSRVLEKCFPFSFFLFNIVLTWKIVGASKASVIYIYIYI